MAGDRTADNTQRTRAREVGDRVICCWEKKKSLQTRKPSGNPQTQAPHGMRVYNVQNNRMTEWSLTDASVHTKQKQKT